MKISASMYDYARGQCVSLNTLENIITRSAEFGHNAFVLNFEDAAQFLMPELHKGSLTLEMLSHLDRFANERGITIIPVIPCLSHSTQTFMHEAYSDLAEFPGTCVYDLQNPKTVETLTEFLKKAAEIFTGEYIHIGCDEAWDMGMGRAPSEPWPKQLFCDHVNKMAEVAISLGKKPLFWGDMVSRYFPELASKINKDLIPVEWCYNHEKSFPRAAWWREHGFDQVVIAPSIGYDVGIFPGMHYASNNIYSYISAGQDAGAMGVILTAWEHLGVTRYAEREQMNYLGGYLVKNGTDKSVDEILREYWQGKSAEHTDETIEFYSKCDAFSSLLPERFTDYCDNALIRREHWGNFYVDAAVQLKELERQEKSISQLAGKIANGCPADQYNPFRVAALRSRHILAMLRLNDEDISSTSERIDTLKELSRQEWLEEREVLADSPLHDILKQYDHQKAAVAKLASSGKKPELPLPAHPAIQASLNEFAQEPAINSLAVKNHPGQPEDEATKIWFAWNETGLNIKCHCHQSGPARAVETGTDLILTRDDLISFQIDPTHEHCESFWIEFNPAGTNLAELHDIEGKKVFDPRLPVKVEVSAQVEPELWVLDILIPFNSLGIDTPNAGDTLGLAVHRINRHTKQASCWAGDPTLARSAPAALGHLILAGTA